ncbi:GNAT acetyltransferase 2-domain-containing protein [Fimicolochytrium jonesii]|uniref:GNAT acetyltransferase 2-domain-containing protein n=1 Tax=Fimicolochytrium jonesii TaxID=1396493 RepID=UPI0022FF40A0|nr:GNAT acetyltransferase 2-domain-containing protein [Fimicolochytrium jonesii]KAI8827007.1 GNAT acetyltransferase 2-domain-containing protein [Fimicolochytrium jonesii]
MVQNTQRKKLDSRIPTLIQNNVQKNKRSFFVLVGDRGRDQVVTMHFLLAKARVAARPDVLWCYKKELGFSSHRKKRINQIKRQIARGIREADQEDPFELFVSSTSIRYTYYKETEKILGNTYGMCVLQDFEALTPNLLARTIETVEGGGIVVILLKTMNSLKQLYSMTMDVHSRYRTESHQDTVARFNERFILSLGSCESCLVVDDELNVLPLSAGKNVKPLPRLEETPLTPAQKELADLKTSLKDTEPVGSLVNCAKTLDQAKALLTFIEAIADKSLRSTVSLTAARGRGKSAALGIAMAAAVAYGYSNIFITSPSPENLKTLFEFIFKGFDALGYEEHLDYDIVQSTNPAFQKAVVRVNIFRDHRQTIQWIQPSDSHVLAQAELVVIDEAAAIPLPVVQNLLGPYLVFMASTINGYEGTGRSLSLKLLSQLREQSRGVTSAKGKEDATGVVVSRDGKERKSGDATAVTPAVVGNRTLREIKLEEPIRYASGDPVESWLNKLLCLDCCTPDPSISRSISGCPHPSKCELYYVNRDTLFSFHPVSEAFLQKMMSLYVASHYKNSPNDLQLLSDAPAHHLFVLLPPVDEERTTALPEPLCVVQVCMEGSIAKGSALSALAKGVRAQGDLIPWVITQQFQDDDFATLSGARVVRIATHPDYVGMGYGGRALELLQDYYSGQIASLNEDDTPASVPTESMTRVTDEELEGASLQSDQIKIRDAATMPPLLLKLSERPPRENLHWLGVSYGITASLHKFWKRNGYVPVYLRQTPNELTGEHSCVMLKKLNRNSAPGEDFTITQSEWLKSFTLDFRRRFTNLLAYQFRAFSPILVMSIFEAAGAIKDAPPPSEERDLTVAALSTASEISRQFTPYDLKRLESYTHNLLDYHVIMDLIPSLAQAYFLGRLHRHSSANGSTQEAGGPSASTPTFVKLSPVQAALLAGLGLQKKTVDDLEKELDLPSTQIMALFGKLIRKCHLFLSGVVESDVTYEVEAVVKPVSKADTKRALADAEGEDDDAMDIDDGKARPRDITDEAAWDPTTESLSADLSQGESDIKAALRKEQKRVLETLNLERFAIPDATADSLELGSGSATIVNVKGSGSSSKKRKLNTSATEIAAKFKGDATIVDPKGLMEKKKDQVKKAMKKAGGR